MKQIISIFILLYTNVIFSKTITCSFGTCKLDFTPIIQLDSANKTFVDLGLISSSDTVNVELPPNETPRNLVIASKSHSLAGITLNVDFQSKQKEINSPNIFIISDIIDNLSLNLKGYSGSNGLDASIICANRFKDGTYGPKSQVYFMNRRSGNPSLDINRCDKKDTDHIQQTKFKCIDPGFKLEEFDRVELTRIKVKQRCLATSLRYKCLQKTMSLTCEWGSKARGYVIPRKSYKTGKEGKGIAWTPGKPCYGGAWSSSTSCAYNYGYSAWHSMTYGMAQAAASYPKWWVSRQLNRYSPPYNGGAFIYQNTKQAGSRPTAELRFIDLQKKGQAFDEYCSRQLPGPNLSYWRLNSFTDIQLSSPGLDPYSLDPLPGSNWSVYKTEFYTQCKEFYQKLSTYVDSWTAYGEIGNKCSDANVPEDINSVLPWQEAGMEQQPEFGIEKFFCTPDSCIADSNVKEKNQIFDTIDPTAGANGTQQGFGTIIVYDIINSDIKASEGVPGLGGNHDLQENSATKYCVKKDDFNTQGPNSEYAKNPVISYNIYKWKGLSVKGGQPSGKQQGDAQLNSITIYKKIDSSVRYLIKKTLF